MTEPASAPDRQAADAPPAPPAPQGALADMWEHARELMRNLMAVCGDPCAIAARAVITVKERADVLSWLVPLERAVRKLLLIEALKLAKTLPRSRIAAQAAAAGEPFTDGAAKADLSPAPKPRVRRRQVQDPEDSLQWKVRFNCAPGCAPGADAAKTVAQEAQNRAIDPAAAIAQRHRAWRSVPAPEPGRGGRFVNAWPLAERVEALARVFGDRAPLVERLARKLVKARAVKNILAFVPLIRPDDKPPSVFGRSLNDEATIVATPLLAALDTS